MKEMTKYIFFIAFFVRGILLTGQVGLNYVMDYEGNKYKTVRIGTQYWFAEDLNTKYYQNGDEIVNIKENEKWSSTQIGAWCNYEHNSSSSNKKLYNWYATTDPRKLCPLNWRVPTVMDWYKLESFLGGYKMAAAKLRSSGEINSFNSTLTGYRYEEGGFFSSFDKYTMYWTSNEFYKGYSRAFSMFKDDPLTYFTTHSNNNGMAIRCIKN